MSDTRLLRTGNWRVIPLEQDASKILEDEFNLMFLESAIKNDPENIEILMQLGDIYSKRHLIKKSLKIDLELVKFCPEEKVFHYNLACSYSLLKDLDLSMLALEKALLLGYDDLVHIQNDTDLDNLRKDKRFQRLVRAHFNREPQI